MKVSQVVCSALALIASTAHAYQSSSSRRAFVQSAATAFVVGTTTAANAMEACPKGSNNCIRTTWTPPSGTSKADIAKTVQAVLLEYPQVRWVCQSGKILLVPTLCAIMIYEITMASSRS